MEDLFQKQARARTPFARRLCLALVLCFGLISSANVNAKDKKAEKKRTAVPKHSPTPALKPIDDGSPLSTPTVEVPKSYYWYMKNGCNCAQCRARRQRQEEDRQRLQDNFKP